MKKTIFLYGLALAVLILIMRVIEYRFLVRDLTLEFYIGIVAVFFTALGIWVGLRFTRKKVVVIHPEFQFNEKEQSQRGISKRELEVLELMAQGLANQEIADKLFVSLNTVKTHSSNLFSKLGVSRRTQAIQKAKELNLIP
ncbi:MAG TPA: LuxR C-terminal-related transcriptional regulator [Cyclobacteriaceae bacterium]|nr:LuxR C-terminal-related transcriptional regulator [Cyclobacteriaceae bacterium]